MCEGANAYPLEQPSCHCRSFANVAGCLHRFVASDRIPCGDASQTGSTIIYNKDRTQFDMRPHMESDRWPLIDAAIQQHLQKIYNGKKVAFKERHWILESDGTYDLERIRQSRPSHLFEVNWDAQIAFWNDPKNGARAAQNKQNRAKSKVMESSATREVLPEQGMIIPPPLPCTHSSDVVKLKKREKVLTRQVVAAGVAGPGMISREMMRMTARMGRMRTIARRCWAPPCRPGKSPGNVSPSSFSARPIPGDMSPGKTIPSDKSLGIPRICRWGKWQML
ncbi:hypothetical protein Tco_0459029 [Tanacetum coccineum]